MQGRTETAVLRADKEAGLLAATGQLLEPLGAQTLETRGRSQQETRPSAAGQLLVVSVFLPFAALPHPVRLPATTLLQVGPRRVPDRRD